LSSIRGEPDVVLLKNAAGPITKRGGQYLSAKTGLVGVVLMTDAFRNYITTMCDEGAGEQERERLKTAET